MADLFNFELLSYLPFFLKTGVALLIMFVILRALRPYITDFMKWMNDSKKLQSDETKHRKWMDGFKKYCEKKEVKK